MFLTSLAARNFRNYAELALDFHQGPVVFVGRNSSGKTNVLEAINLLSLGKSFRKVPDSELIRWGEDGVQVRAEFERADEKLELEMRGARTAIAGSEGAGAAALKKVFLLNGAPAPLVTFLGSVIAVVFSPQDVELLSAPPALRRRFLDMVLCKTSREYCTAVIEYPKILARRNKLLAFIRDGLAQEDELAFWDERAAAAAACIVSERAEFIAWINERISDLYMRLADNSMQKKKIAVQYRAPIDLSASTSQDFTQGCAAREFIAQAILARMQRDRKRDVIFASTRTGPHRDDVVVTSDDHEIANVGSRGDQRVAVLALKLLQKEFLAQRTETSPVLLLDDVYSELDTFRCTALAEMMQDSQVFITTTSAKLVPREFRSGAQIFTIKEGVASHASTSATAKI